MILQGKVVVVTGGAGLIGRAFVRAIVDEGGIAIVAERDTDAGQRVVDAIGRDGPPDRAELLNLDITSKDSVTSAISHLHEKHGRIDALVNNAFPRNANYGRPFEAVTYEDFCENVATHLGGYFLTAQQFAAYFKTQGHGTIINIGSIYGVVPPRFGIYADTPMTMPVEYAAIKSGIIHLTKYMAQYLKGTNIRVNCISPGGVFDGQPAAFVGRYNSYGASKGMLHPTDLQGALLFLLSSMATFVNGQNIVVDDGWSL